ncbi:MAG: lysoplasmalogenase, partial [Myxococcales bacterium]|nr:lysoplasmalogenase [Myxococcales bacterium]
ERRESTVGRLLSKPVASAGFLWAAHTFGAFETLPGRAIFVGLCLSYVGDVALIFSQRAPFLLGLVSFLLGHVAYSVAAVMHGVEWLWVAGAAALLVPYSALIYMDLRPKLPDDMLIPVVAYMVVISAMVTLTLGAAGAETALVVFALGAFLFFLSDISVALDRFGGAGFGNRALGLPLYYVAQLVMAAVCGLFLPGAGA